MESGGKDDAACKCIDDLLGALDAYIPRRRALRTSRS
jgi:hypothetical protein